MPDEQLIRHTEQLRHCLPRGCAAYTPCLMKDARAAPVSVFTFCAGLDRQHVGEQMMLSYGKRAHHCLKDDEALASLVA